jgi:nitrite reductase (NO-forming)
MKTFIVLLAISMLMAGMILNQAFFVKYLEQFKAQAQTIGTKNVLLVANEKEVQVAPDNPLFPGGVNYKAMVFNGTIPGPIIAVDQNETLNITLKNAGKVVHSLIVQAGFGTSDTNSGPVQPGQSKTFTLRAENPGAFLYMDGGAALSGIWEHVASGMYGGIVVHAINERPAKEFYVTFGEMYVDSIKGLFNGTNGVTGSFDFRKFIANEPDLVTTNGMAFKYVPVMGEIRLNMNADIFKVKPGELTRWYIVNGGPRGDVAFNFIGGMLDVRDGSLLGNYGQQLRHEETWIIPPGSASVIETSFPEAGMYTGIDHDLGHMIIGGAFNILATDNSTATDMPEGTAVPPRTGH